ncbi:hypothetical protein KY285_030075 [Solanum tuberosum]|nr:hypothetical protein KY285_030075 [Solanum tuberosum]
MLPSYRHDSGFLYQSERTNWLSLDAYKDKETGTLLEPPHTFEVEFLHNIMQQDCDNLGCRLFVAAFVEFLSDGIPVPSNGFCSDFHRTRYAALLWEYGIEKAKA